MAKMRARRISGSRWVTRSGSRPSGIARASRSAMPSRRSAWASNMTPPSELIRPPSKAAVIFLRRTAGKQNGRRLSSVMAGVRASIPAKGWLQQPNPTPDQQLTLLPPPLIRPRHEYDRLAALRALSSNAFERLAQRLLREAGFLRVEVTGRSGDEGIDGIGVLRVNLLSFHVLFQCKRYQGSVGAGAIRDFRGAMVGRSDKGLLITTGTFTPDAKREATRDGAPAIDLIDGDQLCDLLKQLKLGVNTELVESMSVDSDWFAGI